MTLRCGMIAWLFLFWWGCTSNPDRDRADQLNANDENSSVPLEELATPSPSNASRRAAGDFDDRADAPKMSPEDLEEGFCKDDIYAKFLHEKYLQTQASRTFSHRRYQARLSREDAELDALYYTYSRFVGPMAPYFGAIPVVANERVEYWMRYFKSAGRKMFAKWLVRGETFKEVFRPLLQEEGMPPELIYLAMVESGFNNAAYSRAKATGPWQFMQGTARLYGLKVNHWIDERRDPVKSTLAAARYIRDLYEEFGDWYLAMAAYNAGPGKIRSAIRRTGSNSFWDIAATRYIRTETKDYVPRVLAALILSSRPELHGFEASADPADMFPMTVVKVKKPARLSELADLLGVQSEDIARWNPEIVRGVTPPGNRDGYELRLDPLYVKKFASVENSLSSLSISDVTMHRIQSGDTLGKLARKYRVRVSTILSANPDLRVNKLRIGQSIAIPIPGFSAKKSKNVSAF